MASGVISILCSLGRSSVCLNLGVEYDFFLIVDV